MFVKEIFSCEVRRLHGSAVGPAAARNLLVNINRVGHIAVLPLRCKQQVHRFFDPLRRVIAVLVGMPLHGGRGPLPDALVDRQRFHGTYYSFVR